MQDIRERTFDFALRIVKLCQELVAASKIIPAGRLSELQAEAQELSKIIGSIIVTAKKRK